MKKFIAATLALCLSAGAVNLSADSAKCPAKTAPCPVEGCGKSFDPELNRQKNRTAQPGGYQEKSFAEFVKLNQKAVNKKGRQSWSTAQKAQVAEVEDGPGVVVVGYLYDALQSGHESCNCMRDSEEWKDFHIWIVSSKSAATKAKSFVVEITPRVRQDHPGWTVKKLRKLILPQAWTKVRVTGLVTFDSEHWNFVRDGKRATVWEIHPVTEFEMCPSGATCSIGSDSGWVKLEAIP